MKALTACLILCLSLLNAVPPAPAEETEGSPQEEMNNLTDTFVTVPTNPLPGDLPWLLWLTAQETPASQAAETAPSPLAEAAAKYEELVRTKGVHYLETISVMGMDMKAEYWLKGGKLKKNEQASKQTYLYDGEWFYMYATKGNTGVRMAPDDPEASDFINAMQSGLLPHYAASPYRQQEDRKTDGFDCQVFYLDIEMTDMKGNWLFVDKKTGALVKNQYGEGKGGMLTTVTRLETGNFGDEVFALPKNLKVTGP